MCKKKEKLRMDIKFRHEHPQKSNLNYLLSVLGPHTESILLLGETVFHI